MQGLDLESKDLDEVKKDLILNNIGSSHFKSILDHIGRRDLDTVHYNEVMEYMTRRYQRKINIFYERYKFGNRSRHHSESDMDFIAALKELSVNCDFGEATDERVRDRFVLQLNDQSIQQDLMRKFHTNDATLDEVLEEVLVLSTSTKAVSIMKNNTNNKGDSDEVVMKVSPDRASKKQSENRMSTTLPMVLDPKVSCVRCGRSKHKLGDRCPATNIECHLCKAKGHFAAVCIKFGKA
ncbi:hypothetical protein RF11_04778 [Thelohanellus kitauei]|uniref:CCHC-type domain-containing protein n=1 Tax=Thelohanellus kitauei TaxID=669202 RepID=A0A0C2MLL4_THEKT|nr:hypothetical protein RF11_04778 [Thelohanellus kitauei]